MKIKLRIMKMIRFLLIGMEINKDSFNQFNANFQSFSHTLQVLILDCLE